MTIYLYTHPHMPLSKFSSLMQDLVDDFDYLAETNDLTFPMVVKWEGVPHEWGRFTKEVFDNDLPIKISVNVKEKACMILCLKDFRNVFDREDEHHA